MKLVFSQSRGFPSNIIRWFTKSDWSHCFIVLDDSLEGDALVFESSKGGVKLNLWSNYSYKKCAIFNINQSMNLKPLYKYFGSNYGYFQILGYTIAKIFKLKHNPIKKDYICSEIALRFLIENNLIGFETLDPNNASPEDLYKIIKEHKDFSLIN